LIFEFPIRIFHREREREGREGGWGSAANDGRRGERKYKGENEKALR